MTTFLLTVTGLVVLLAAVTILYDWLCPPVYPKDDPFSWRDD